MEGKVQKASLLTNEFDPKVLQSALFTQGMTYPEGYSLGCRYIYDYEIEFFTDSRGSMFIDNIHYPINKGDIVFRKPGQTTEAIMPYCCYLICIDLAGNSGKKLDSYDFRKKQQFQFNYQNPILDVIPSVFHSLEDEKYYKLFDTVLNEFVNPREESPILLKALVLQIITLIYQDIRSFDSYENIPSSSHSNIVSRAIKYMQQNIHKKISLKELSHLSGLSANHFHMVFKKITHVTPNEYVTQIKLEKSKELLVKTNLAVYEIALNCGFENTHYFNFLFKKYFRVTPGEFRKKHSYLLGIE